MPACARVAAAAAGAVDTHAGMLYLLGTLPVIVVLAVLAVVKGGASAQAVAAARRRA